MTGAAAPPFDRYAFTPSPARSWGIVVDGGLRLNPETKVQALIWAAQQAEADWRFISSRDNWLHIRRLMRDAVRGDEFGSLVSAVAVGQSDRELQQIAERLVGAM